MQELWQFKDEMNKIYWENPKYYKHMKDYLFSNID